MTATFYYRTYNVLAAFFGALVAVAGFLVGQNYWNDRPVSHVTSLELIHTANGNTEVQLSWINRRGCTFLELVAQQGHRDGRLHALLFTVTRKLGSRGAGSHSNDTEVWTIHRPARIIGPRGYLDVWHNCGGRPVQSNLVDVPIAELFP